MTDTPPTHELEEPTMPDTTPDDLDEATGEPIIRDDELVDAVIVDDELELDRQAGDAAALEADTLAELEAMTPEELTELVAATELELEGQAGAELVEDLGPAPLNPEPLPGFVRMHHPEIAATADVSESAVYIHKARGWVLLEELPTEANLELETELEADTTNTEAPASATEED